MGVAAVIPHNPQDFLKSYCGPEVNIQEEPFRGNPVKFSSNVTYAFVPEVFTYNPQQNLKVEVETLVKRPKFSIQLLESIRDLIQDQFECRIANFWIQALLVYKTGLQFIFCNTADYQVGNAPPYSKMVPASEQQGEKEYACVHMATLPTLRVLSTTPDKAIAFGQGSFFHLQANATVWLPGVVNKADKLLDICTGFKQKVYDRMEQCTFRQIATYLLRDVATGHLNPKEALTYFLQQANAFIPFIDANKMPSQSEQFVLHTYKSVSETYLKKLAKGDYLIEALSGRCFSQIKGEEFYMSVQKEMHSLFSKEMNAKKPQIIVDPTLSTKLSSNRHPKRFTIFLEQFFKDEIAKTNTSLRAGNTVEKYVKLSVQEPAVVNNVLVYMTNLENESDFRVDLQYILKIKSKETLNKVGLPNRILTVYNTVLSALSSKSSGPKGPKNMNAIIIKVLTRVSTHN